MANAQPQFYRLFEAFLTPLIIGVPRKFINLIHALYNGASCRIRHEQQLKAVKGPVGCWTEVRSVHNSLQYPTTYHYAQGGTGQQRNILAAGPRIFLCCQSLILQIANR